MKRLTATVLFFTALSTPVLAETPAQREQHSWGYVQQVAYPPEAQQQEAAPAEHPMPHNYYHHDGAAKKHGKKHHGAAHHAKKHDDKAVHHRHHHHHTKTAHKAVAKPAQDNQKQ